MSATILIVEDDPLGRDLVHGILDAVGYAVLQAEDGVGLLERVKTERPDLILMDLQLPRIDGVTLIRDLKADGATRPIPIIVTTAYAHPELQANALQAGCTAYLTKPLDFRTLTKAVAEVLKR